LKEESQRKKTTIPRTEMSYSRLRIISSAAPAARTDAVIALSDPRLGPDKILSLGVVSGRNIWRNDYRHSLQTISQSVFKYPNEVGPGLYDIHSPRVPSAEEMIGLLKKALQVLPRKQVWVNSDCGLKTRGWPEVQES
jgi:methionine synthase II (cobalamin-independent)